MYRQTRSLIRSLTLFCTDDVVSHEIEQTNVFFASKAAGLIYIWLQGIVASTDISSRTLPLRSKIEALKRSAKILKSQIPHDPNKFEDGDVACKVCAASFKYKKKKNMMKHLTVCYL